MTQLLIALSLCTQGGGIELTFFLFNLVCDGLVEITVACSRCDSDLIFFSVLSS